MGLFPDRWAELCARDRIPLEPLAAAANFDELYAANLRNLRAVLGAHVEQRNRTEARGVEYNPCPLHSATLDDCIEQARDMMAGGARYSFGSVSLTGIGTLIDSLYALRVAVFERGLVSMAQLQDMLMSDFASAEPFRRFLAQRLPKYGQEDETIRAFSAAVFADVATAADGLTNTRGGRYEASLFAFRTFVPFGERTMATPDGRRAGAHLSPGMGPSLISLGAECSLSHLLRSLEPLDMTAYPVVAVLDAKLPVTRTRQGPEAVAAALRCFLHYGGSVLQLNVVDPQQLLEARQNPELHPDLVVRISGYSACFRTLPPALQDEVIQRTLAVG
jgi:trans-4-hydroxy-L-proline dehydratase